MDKFIPVNYHINNNGCYSLQDLVFRKLKSAAYELTLINKKLV